MFYIVLHGFIGPMSYCIIFYLIFRICDLWALIVVAQIWQPNGCSPCPIWYIGFPTSTDSVPKEQNGASGSLPRLLRDFTSCFEEVWRLQQLILALLHITVSHGQPYQAEGMKVSGVPPGQPQALSSKMEGTDKGVGIWLGTIWGLINLTRHAFGCIWNEFGFIWEKHGNNFEYMTTQIWLKLHLFHMFLVSRTLGTRERSLFLSCTMMIVRPYGCVGWVGVGWGWGGGGIGGVEGVGGLLSPVFPDALDAMLLTSWRKFPKRSWCYALDVFT